MVSDKLGRLLTRHLFPLFEEDLFDMMLFESLKKQKSYYLSMFSENNEEFKRRISLCRSIKVPSSLYDLVKRCENDLNNLRKRYENAVKWLLSPMYSSRVPEDVRLGMYRTLFIESYNIVYGIKEETLPIAYTYHGVFREYLIKIEQAKMNVGELNLGKDYKIPTGIDLVFFIKAPYKDGYVVLPLIIAGKYDEKGIREVKLTTAIKYALRGINKDSNEYTALKFMPRLTRVALLKTSESLPGKPKECILTKKIGNLTIYRDFPCSILYPILIDIPRLYSRLDNDLKDLTRLRLEDWFKALLILSSVAIIPKAPVIVTSKKPPEYPGGGSALINTIKMLHGRVVETKELLKVMNNNITITLNELYNRYLNELEETSKEHYRKIKVKAEKLKLKLTW